MIEEGEAATVKSRRKQPHEHRGMTLVEFLIVIAVIAIMAAILVPSHTSCPIRNRVSRAKSDMRSMATALEAYSVEHDLYPAHEPLRGYVNEPDGRAAKKLRKAGGWNLFAVKAGAGGLCHGLTTPVAYITAIPSDPFAESKGMPFAYYNDKDIGWILYSPGPDGVYDIDPKTDYDSSDYNPNDSLLYGKTYDTTNGTKSSGDIWRFASQ
jgi:prepilin-type N-terminal cleavage/methylation domain-containing protein